MVSPTTDINQEVYSSYNIYLLHLLATLRLPKLQRVENPDRTVILRSLTLYRCLSGQVRTQL